MTLRLRHVDTSTPVSPRLQGSVVKGESLKRLVVARDAIALAQAEADRLLDAARREAEGLAERHLRERELALAEREAQLETQMWQRVAGHADAVTREWDRAVSEVQEQGARLVAHALSRLSPELLPQARLRGCVAELMACVRAPQQGVLTVAREDEALVASLPGLPWSVRVDGELAPGAVRLVCAQGVWECDVLGMLERLLGALDPAESTGKMLDSEQVPQEVPALLHRS